MRLGLLAAILLQSNVHPQRLAVPAWVGLTRVLTSHQRTWLEGQAPGQRLSWMPMRRAPKCVLDGAWERLPAVRRRPVAAAQDWPPRVAYLHDLLPPLQRLAFP
jgi:hypothetical protein